MRAAAAAAFEIQDQSARANEGAEADRQILLRTGVEVSDVIVGQDDLYGHGVNMAARLMSLWTNVGFES